MRNQVLQIPTLTIDGVTSSQMNFWLRLQDGDAKHDISAAMGEFTFSLMGGFMVLENKN